MTMARARVAPESISSSRPTSRDSAPASSSVGRTMAPPWMVTPTRFPPGTDARLRRPGVVPGPGLPGGPGGNLPGIKAVRSARRGGPGDRAAVRALVTHQFPAGIDNAKHHGCHLFAGSGYGDRLRRHRHLGPLFGGHTRAAESEKHHAHRQQYVSLKTVYRSIFTPFLSQSRGCLPVKERIPGARCSIKIDQTGRSPLLQIICVSKPTARCFGIW